MSDVISGYSLNMIVNYYGVTLQEQFLIVIYLVNCLGCKVKNLLLFVFFVASLVFSDKYDCEFYVATLLEQFFVVSCFSVLYAVSNLLLFRANQRQVRRLLELLNWNKFRTASWPPVANQHLAVFHRGSANSQSLLSWPLTLFMYFLASSDTRGNVSWDLIRRHWHCSLSMPMVNCFCY